MARDRPLRPPPPPPRDWRHHRAPFHVVRGRATRPPPRDVLFPTCGRNVAHVSVTIITVTINTSIIINMISITMTIITIISINMIIIDMTIMP